VLRDAPVRMIVERFVAEADAASPALIRGFSLVGSLAPGDHRPRAGDIDFVAVAPARPGPGQGAILRRVHARLRRRFRRPRFDGCYVTPDDLGRDPALAVGTLDAHEGRLTVRATAPVTWETLARHGVPLRGSDREDLGMRTDPAALARWTLANMAGYWRPWHARHARSPSPAGLCALGSRVPA
jgi:hypothetical protein